MRKIKAIVSWVVYRMSLQKAPLGGIVVCEQKEWDEMQQGQSCTHTLIQEGIADEADAERLARSQLALTSVPSVRLKARS